MENVQVGRLVHCTWIRFGANVLDFNILWVDNAQAVNPENMFVEEGVAKIFAPVLAPTETRVPDAFGATKKGGKS